METKTAPINVSQRMWIHSSYFAFALFLTLIAYVWTRSGQLNLFQLSSAVAGTGAFLIGSSLILTPLCYYFDFLDRKAGYKKYLGLMGYFFALTYSIMLLFVDPERYFFGFAHNFFTPDFILGLSAMSILTFMALISNTRAMKLMGPVRWRKSLRLGYVAYFLLVLRAFHLEGTDWVLWWYHMNTLPPPRILVSFFAIFVIMLRISMLFVKEPIRSTQPTEVTPSQSD